MSKRKLPDWCKEGKCALIMKDMSVSSLANELGMSRTYVSQVINGNSYAPEIARRISEVLDIKTPYPESII